MFIDGFLGLASTIGAGVCGEPTTPGYARQPVTFGRSVNGVSMLSSAFSFGPAGARGLFVGRAVFDAPTGGNLLFTLPYSGPRQARGMAFEAGDVGLIRLLFSVLAQYPDGDAYEGGFAALTQVGATYDDLDLLVPPTIQVAGGHYVPNATLSPITTGVALTITRGILRAT